MVKYITNVHTVRIIGLPDHRMPYIFPLGIGSLHLLSVQHAQI